MNNEVFNEFLRMNQYVDGHVKKWYPVDDDSIIVESDDGCYKYDSILHTTRYSRNVSKLLSFNVEDKKHWIREFSYRLYRKIKSSGYTQETLSFDSKVGSSSISAYVNGERIPSIYNLLKLADSMNCRISEIIELLCIDVGENDESSERAKLDFMNDEEEWLNEFSYRLYKLLRKTKMSQTCFAEKIGISKSLFNKYIKGEVMPSSYTIHSIIKTFDLNKNQITELLGIC